MSYLLVEGLLRLVKPLFALILAAVLYWVLTALVGEPGSVLLGLACWISAGVFIQLVESGII